ncbi:hypothetical protein S40293_04660 [Stachybotrys chartarum IBT 40293]|nr:hypothetical protein S40293_04660 [Stachybotrys chartarum IBT 40293]KFA78986.1 hypothetical protein S40288_00560 [Stachybotrys chartarum IBT 40288]
MDPRGTQTPESGVPDDYEYISPIGFSYYANATSLSPQFYQTLLDRSWRRSGKLLYRPDQKRSCCPHYTIRLDSGRFKPARDQRQTINRFNNHIIGESYAKEAARLYPRSREQSKKRNNEFCLTERVHEAEYAQLRTPPDPAHSLEITLDEDKFTEEKYLVYANYQEVVHHEKPQDISRKSFKRFLCSSPLRRQLMEAPNGRKKKLGSYHQCYRIDGKLVAVGVLDLLPDCVSSVYFFYHESIHKYAPGKLGALHEIALAIEDGYRWWYPGFYIHSCPKMRYKLDYSPQEILDPIALTWDPLDAEVRRLLDQKSFVSLSMERKSLRSVGEGAETTASEDEPSKEGSDVGSDDENGQSIFQLGLPGITPISTMETVDLDHIPLILPKALYVETSDLVAWDSQTIHSWPGIKASVAELVAALGSDLVNLICLDLLNHRDE